MKNSLRKRILKLDTFVDKICSSTCVSEKLNWSLISYDVVPSKPRMHPSKDVDVFEVYVIISESIKISPYESGNPNVESTLIVVSKNVTFDDNLVDSIKFAKLSTLIYWSIFWSISLVCPSLSNEI